MRAGNRIYTEAPRIELNLNARAWCIRRCNNLARRLLTDDFNNRTTFVVRVFLQKG